jgi:hypothetical protein
MKRKKIYWLAEKYDLSYGIQVQCLNIYIFLIQQSDCVEVPFSPPSPTSNHGW